jgi:LacI family transcriptional regulator
MKKPTMKDVAKAAGVSQSTVSFVINDAPISISDEVKQRVLQTIDDLGFVPRAKAKNYSSLSDSIIALFIPNASNFFYMELIKGINIFTKANGYRLIVINTNRDVSNEQYYLSLLQKTKVAGIIYGFTPTIKNVEMLRTLNIPLIVIGEVSDELDVDVISLNSFLSGEMIANHLVSRGHKHVSFITSPTNKISLSRKRRLNGIEHALSDHAELKVFSEISEHEHDSSNYELELGYNIMKRMLENGNMRSTALIGANDMISFGIIKALGEAKIKVPEQVSVCGFDNILFSELITPSLTTVDHCTHWRCSLAVEILDNKIKNKYLAPAKINYDPILIVRNSTGKAPTANSSLQQSTHVK